MSIFSDIAAINGCGAGILTNCELVEEGTALRPALKVMLMTGYAQDPVPDFIARAGIRVLYKPFNVDDLAVWAQQVLGRKV
jgi:hypothetical protein